EAGELRRAVMPERPPACQTLVEALGTARSVRRSRPIHETGERMDASLTGREGTQGRFTWMPRPGSIGVHLMLSAVALLILGPLGGIAAAYMCFTLGIFVPGQILAGILGSVVTYPYGAEGRHGANYMQTMAASVASLGAMAVLIQAAVWLGM